MPIAAFIEGHQLVALQVPVRERRGREDRQFTCSDELAGGGAQADLGGQVSGDEHTGHSRMVSVEGLRVDRLSAGRQRRQEVGRDSIGGPQEVTPDDHATAGIAVMGNPGKEFPQIEAFPKRGGEQAGQARRFLGIDRSHPPGQRRAITERGRGFDGRIDDSFGPEVGPRAPDQRFDRRSVAVAVPCGRQVAFGAGCEKGRPVAPRAGQLGKPRQRGQRGAGE